MFEKKCLLKPKMSLIAMALTCVIGSHETNAMDFDLYGEHSSWSYDVGSNFEAVHFEDSSLIRLRGFGQHHRNIVRPYLSLSGLRDRTAIQDNAMSITEATRVGVGVQVTDPSLPLRLFVEGRVVGESRIPANQYKSWNEALVTGVISGETRPFSEHAYAMTSWYGDVTQVMRLNGENYSAGSAWFRFSASMTPEGPLSIMLDPIDIAVYRECREGCRSWLFGGVALSASYVGEWFSASLRGSFGERRTMYTDQVVRTVDARRVLFTVGGSF